MSRASCFRSRAPAKATALPPALPDVPRSVRLGDGSDAYAFISTPISPSRRGRGRVGPYRGKTPGPQTGLLLFFALAASYRTSNARDQQGANVVRVRAAALVPAWLARRRQKVGGGRGAALLLCAAAGSALDAALFKTYGVPWEKSRQWVSAHGATRTSHIGALETRRARAKVFVYPASSLLYILPASGRCGTKTSSSVA